MSDLYEGRTLSCDVTQNIKACAEDELSVTVMFKNLEVPECVHCIEDRALIQIEFSGNVADAHRRLRLSKQLEDRKTFINSWYSSESRIHAGLFDMENVRLTYQTGEDLSREKLYTGYYLAEKPAPGIVSINSLDFVSIFTYKLCTKHRHPSCSADAARDSPG